MTNRLITEPHLDAPDDFYEALIEAHAGLETAQSHALNARLVLLLANHVGDLAVLREALAAARGNIPAAPRADLPAAPRTEASAAPAANPADAPGASA